MLSESQKAAGPAGLSGPSLIFPDLFGLASREDELAWEPFYPGVEVSWLYRAGDHGAAAAFIRFQPGSRVPLHEHQGFEHIFVLRGSQTDENGRLRAGSLKINRPGTSHSILSEDGCLVLAIYEKRVAFADGPAAAGKISGPV